jgi:uncharacterized protein
MQGISYLQKNNIDFHVIAVITRESLNFPDEIFNFFVEHHIKKIGFNIEEVEGVHTASSLASQGVDTRYREFMQRLYTLTQDNLAPLTIREFENFTNLILNKNDTILSEQADPFVMINIDCDGNFTTFSPEFLGTESVDYNNFVLGNVWYDSFESIYNTEKFQLLYQDIQAGVELCRNTCEYFVLCGGGAPANKYFENGSLRSSETMYCRYVIQMPIDIILNHLEE